MSFVFPYREMPKSQRFSASGGFPLYFPIGKCPNPRNHPPPAVFLCISFNREIPKYQEIARTVEPPLPRPHASAQKLWGGGTSHETCPPDGAGAAEVPPAPRQQLSGKPEKLWGGAPLLTVSSVQAEGAASCDRNPGVKRFGKNVR